MTKDIAATHLNKFALLTSFFFFELQFNVFGSVHTSVGLGGAAPLLYIPAQKYRCPSRSCSD